MDIASTSIPRRAIAARGNRRSPLRSHPPPTALILLVVAATVALSSSSAAVVFADTAPAAACSVPCENGDCVPTNDDAACDCRAGWEGEACSVRAAQCPDDRRVCYNGSECRKRRQPDPDGMYEYECDCSGAFGISAHAGGSTLEPGGVVPEPPPPRSRYFAFQTFPVAARGWMGGWETVFFLEALFVHRESLWIF